MLEGGSAARGSRPDAGGRVGAERPGPTSVVSRYREPALRAMRQARIGSREAVPGQENQPGINLAEKILAEIDTQGAENYRAYKSREFLGVELPITHVSVKALARVMVTPQELLARAQQISIEDARISEEQSKVQNATGSDAGAKKEETREITIPDPAQRKIIAIMPQFSLPPAGHPMELWGEVYHRAIHALPEVLRNMREIIATMPAEAIENLTSDQLNELYAQVPDVEVYGFGYPHSLGGHVTKGWLKAIGEKGFDAYGKLYAEVLQEEILPRNPAVALKDTSIQLEGFSMGGEIARATSEQLNSAGFVDLKERKRLRVLTFISTGEHVPSVIGRVPNFIQKVVGLTAGEFRGKGEEVKIETAGEPVFREALQNLKQFPQDTRGQRLLKWIVALRDSLTISKGRRPPAPTEEKPSARSYEVEGRHDPVNRNWMELGFIWLRSRGKQGNEDLSHTQSPQAQLEELSNGVLPGTTMTVETDAKDTNRIHFGADTKHYIDYKDLRAPKWLNIVEAHILPYVAKKAAEN